MQDDRQMNVSIPRYQQIALEIASKIVNEEYEIGQKIYGRSSVASQYNVSPETARRAFCVLSDLDIVKSQKGSGMVIKSRDNAVDFLTQFNNRTTIETLKTAIAQNIERQQKEMDSLNDNLAELISATEHFRSMNPLMPFSVRITKDCKHLTKSVQQIQFWQHTGATLVAIKRNNGLIRSPGPYATIQVDDIVYFVCQEDSDQRVRDYLF